MIGGVTGKQGAGLGLGGDGKEEETAATNSNKYIALPPRDSVERKSSQFQRGRTRAAMSAYDQLMTCTATNIQ